jgi:PAS domain-containing protein
MGWAPDIFRALFDHAPDAMLVADEGGRCVAANLAACDYLKRAVGDVLGKLVSELTAQAPTTAACVWQRFHHDGRIFHLTVVREWRHSDGARPPTPPLHVTERAQIELALAEAEGNVTRAARMLGIDRRTLQRRINPR